MGPKHEYVFGLEAWGDGGDRKEEKKPSAQCEWMVVPYHMAESMTPPPAAPTETGALQVPKCHICHTNRDSEWHLCLLTYACTAF